MDSLPQGRIQEFKKGGSFKRVHMWSTPKILGDHTHFCQTTPILIKTHLHELYYEQITSLHARWIARRLYSSQTGMARQRWVSNTAGRVTKNQY